MGLNLLTLGDLTIRIGRVVDDSIGALENVYRQIQGGTDFDRSIVAVEHEIAVTINPLRERQMSVFNALLEGDRLRVRQVLMTAISTILTLTPMALGLTEGAGIATDLAIMVIGGSLSSTILTLVVVPIIYSLVESLRGRLLGGDGGGNGNPPPAPVEPKPRHASPIPPLKRLE